METNKVKTTIDPVISVNSSVGSTMGPLRTQSPVPTNYRLARRPNGELILQGAYFWQQGQDYGHEWRNIPTVELDV